MTYLNMAIASFLGVVVGSLTNWLISSPKRRKEEKRDLNNRLDKIEEGTKCLLRSKIQDEYLPCAQPIENGCVPMKRAI